MQCTCMLRGCRKFRKIVHFCTVDSYNMLLHLPLKIPALFLLAWKESLKVYSYLLLLLTCSSTGWDNSSGWSGSAMPLGSLLRRRSDWRVGSNCPTWGLFLGLQSKSIYLGETLINFFLKFDHNKAHVLGWDLISTNFGKFLLVFRYGTPMAPKHHEGYHIGLVLQGFVND